MLKNVPRPSSLCARYGTSSTDMLLVLEWDWSHAAGTGMGPATVLKRRVFARRGSRSWTRTLSRTWALSTRRRRRRRLRLVLLPTRISYAYLLRPHYAKSGTDRVRHCTRAGEDAHELPHPGTVCYAEGLTRVVVAAGTDVPYRATRTTRTTRGTSSWPLSVRTSLRTSYAMSGTDSAPATPCLVLTQRLLRHVWY
eukprot:2131242-Rhodomonas_salina.4